mmetsp:Transcript_64753/g.189892  ORF Transcript_64753/g.189892 Transcript_64753/m.189892 type:complete len:451 (+) Transcript_64753:2005-3357(+)
MVVELPQGLLGGRDHKDDLAAAHGVIDRVQDQAAFDLRSQGHHTDSRGSPAEVAPVPAAVRLIQGQPGDVEVPTLLEVLDPGLLLLPVSVMILLLVLGHQHVRDHRAPACAGAGLGEQGALELVDAEAARRPDAHPDGPRLARRPLEHQPHVHVRKGLLHGQSPENVAGVLLVYVVGVQIRHDEEQRRLAHAQALHVLVPRGVAHEVVGSEPRDLRERRDGLMQLSGLLGGGHEREVGNSDVAPGFHVREELLQERLQDRGAPPNTPTYDDHVLRAVPGRLELALARVLKLVELHEAIDLSGEEVDAYDDRDDDEEARERRCGREITVPDRGDGGEHPVDHLDEGDLAHPRRREGVREHERVTENLQREHRAAERDDKHGSPQERDDISARDLAEVFQCTDLLQLLVRDHSVVDPQVGEAEPGSRRLFADEGGRHCEDGDERARREQEGQ